MKDAIEVSIIFHEGQRMFAVPKQAAPVQEPFGYLFQHEETGLTTVVDVQQVEWGFEKNNPRHQKIGPVYATPPAQPATEESSATQPVQEPVAWRWVNPKGWLTYGEAPHDTFKSTALYTTPPAQPAVPDAFGTQEGEHPEYIQGWNDCRAEMLKGMK